MDRFPFPKKIQIQTTVACGAACAICPHATRSKDWPNGRMDDALFDRAVEQLRGWPVECVSPYLMADPLSDRKIFDRIRQLRSALPQTGIELSTTGKYLAPAIADKLIGAPITELRISSHGISAEDYARTMPGVDFDRAMTNIRRFIGLWNETRPYALYVVSMWGLWPRGREAEIEAYWRDLGVEVCKWRIVSRGGQVDLSDFEDGSPDPTLWATGKQDPPYLCRHHRDTEWLHILSDGRATLCCMDYGQEVILGNVAEEDIEAIWTGERFNRVREMIRGARPMPDGFLCNRCELHVSESIYDEQNRRNAEARRPIRSTSQMSNGV